MADIRIDRYEVNVGANGSTQAITDIGDVNKAFVRLVGNSIKGSSGPTGATGNCTPQTLGLAVQLTATNEVTFYRASSTVVKVMFEVWSYQGSGGGTHEFTVRQRGNITVSNGTSGNTAAISGMTDRNDAVPIYQGWTSGETSTSDYEAVSLACHITDASDVSFSRGNNGGSSSITAYYTIVEFIGSAWSVGTAVSTSHDTAGPGGILVTMNTDSDGVGGSTFDVTDWGTAMILECSMGGDGGGETGLADAQVVFQNGDATTNVRLRLGEANARNDDDAYAYVIQNDDMAVYRTYNANYSENNGGTSTGADIIIAGVDSATPLDELAVEFSVTTTGTGTAWARGCLSARLTDYDTIDTYVHRSGNNVMINAGIVDLSALVDVGGGSTGQIKVWTGSAWEAKPMKVWNGSSWEIKPVKFYNGSSWEETNY